ncbi:MAG: hypothetical protein IJ959_00630, partial [Clostridia bacterium]|nr:hypothetical protein [Clostridia bacterium]
NISVRIIAFFIGFEGYKIAITGALMALAGIPNGMMGIATTTIWGDGFSAIAKNPQNKWQNCFLKNMETANHYSNKKS